MRRVTSCTRFTVTPRGIQAARRFSNLDIAALFRLGTSAQPSSFSLSGINPQIAEDAGRSSAVGRSSALPVHLSRSHSVFESNEIGSPAELESSNLALTRREWGSTTTATSWSVPLMALASKQTRLSPFANWTAILHTRGQSPNFHCIPMIGHTVNIVVHSKLVKAVHCANHCAKRRAPRLLLRRSEHRPRRTGPCTICARRLLHT